MVSIFFLGPRAAHDMTESFASSERLAVFGSTIVVWLYKHGIKCSVIGLSSTLKLVTCRCDHSR